MVLIFQCDCSGLLKRRLPYGVCVPVTLIAMSSPGQPKWAFVYWIESKDWSVHPVECITQQEMLFNPKLQGMVEYRVGDKPEKGWPKYRAKVLAVGKTKEKAENLGLEQLKLYEESASTKPEPAKKSQEKVKSNKSKSDKVKKGNHKERANTDHQSKKARLASDQRSTSSSEDEATSDKLAVLLKRIEVLEAENRNLLKKNLLLQDKLPALIESQKHAPCPVSPKLAAINSMRRLTVASSEGEDSSASNASSGSCSSVGSIMNMETAREELLAFADKEELELAIRDAGDYRKLIANVMNIVLDEDDFKTKSLTGFNTTKPAIDKQKITSIKNFVRCHYPDVRLPDITLKMGAHLRDVRDRSRKSSTS